MSLSSELKPTPSAAAVVDSELSPAGETVAQQQKQQEKEEIDQNADQLQALKTVYEKAAFLQEQKQKQHIEQFQNIMRLRAQQAKEMQQNPPQGYEETKAGQTARTNLPI